VVTALKRSWNDDALMWTEPAISSTVTGCAKMLAYPGHGFGNPLHSGLRLSDLGDTSANRRAQQTNQDLVDHERSEEVRILRPGHQIQQARHGVDDGVGRASDIQPAIVRHLGDAMRVYPLGEFSHARKIQVQLEAEKGLPSARSSHVPGDRQIDREDQHARGIVLEHFAAKHDGLGTLSHHAERRPLRRVNGLLRHPRSAQGIGSREAKRKHPIVPGILRDQVGQSSQGHGPRGREAEVVKRCAGC
jgi:hypothetical protein